jgi:hypothetical protein
LQVERWKLRLLAAAGGAEFRKLNGVEKFEEWLGVRIRR